MIVKRRCDMPVAYRCLPSRNGCSGQAEDNRLFLEAVLWIVRTGSPWRDLPSELGNWHTTYTRFKRWGESGVWRRVVEAASGDRDLEMLMIDSTAVRAPPVSEFIESVPGMLGNLGAAEVLVDRSLPLVAFRANRPVQRKGEGYLSSTLSIQAA